MPFLIHIKESSRELINMVELPVYIFGTEIEYRFDEL